MSEKVKKVVLALENCEIISIPVENIEYMYVEGFDETCQFSQYDKTMHKDKQARFFKMNINEGANILENTEKDFNIDQMLPFERIMRHQDIAQIHIEYENDETEWFFAPWEGDDYTNQLQDAKMNDKGDMLVIQCGKRTV